MTSKSFFVCVFCCCCFFVFALFSHMFSKTVSFFPYKLYSSLTQNGWCNKNMKLSNLTSWHKKAWKSCLVLSFCKRLLLEKDFCRHQMSSAHCVQPAVCGGGVVRLVAQPRLFWGACPAGKSAAFFFWVNLCSLGWTSMFSRVWFSMQMIVVCPIRLKLVIREGYHYYPCWSFCW